MVSIPWAVRNSANRLLQIKITKGFQLEKMLFLQNTIEQLALKWGIMLWSGPAEVFSAFRRERNPWGAKQCSPRKENISELEEVQGGQPMRDKHSGLQLERQRRGSQRVQRSVLYFRRAGETLGALLWIRSCMLV